MKIKKNTKKYVIRAVTLVTVFILALILYFTWSFFNTEKEYTVYTSMEEPVLPVMYNISGDREINCLHGYLQDMKSEVNSDSIIILPENRKLEMRIAEYNNMVAKISYEIRSLDLKHFIEKTDVSEIRRGNDGNTYITLPIQNLIEKDRQYLLKIQLDTGEKTVNYYTRIIWTDKNYIEQMIDLALEFTEKTFDYNAAKDLTAYLEINPNRDNSDLADVDISSSFSQITWAGTGMKLASKPEVCVREYDGIMCLIDVSYTAERINELNKSEKYRVKDTYTMRMGSQRIYLMNFDRKTNQIFEGNKHLFTGKRILLGIADSSTLQTAKSKNERFIVFKTNKEIWSYDQKEKKAVNIFSFRSENDDGVRADYDRHDLKILSVDDNGNVDFVVYGYMNRGRHEGYNGIVYYHYSEANDTIIESFFIPIEKSYEKIKYELDELCIKGANDMLYMKQNNAIVAIDLKSLETLDIASNLEDGGYAISKDQTSIAWLDGGLYSSVKIQFMNITTGNTHSINANIDEFLRIIGFSGHDLIYGRAKNKDFWYLSNRIKGLPMYKLEIIDENQRLQKEYQRDDVYIENVRIEDNRIHLKIYNKADEPNSYKYWGEDTIICKESSKEYGIDNIASENTNDRKKIYYVILDEEIKTTRNLKVRVPGKISYENAGRIELMRSGKVDQKLWLYAYENGRLSMVTTSLDKAMEYCYDELGFITDKNGSILYNRTDRESQSTIDSPLQKALPIIKNLETFRENKIYEDDGIIMLDAQGLDLNQISYYIYQGLPVVFYTKNMRYYIIYGYDNFNIKVYDPFEDNEENRTFLMGKEEAENWFINHQSDFVAAVQNKN